MVSLGEFGILFILPFFFEGVLGYSALATGAVFLAIAVGTILAGGATPELARMVGARGVARLARGRAPFPRGAGGAGAGGPRARRAGHGTPSRYPADRA